MYFRFSPGVHSSSLGSIDPSGRSSTSSSSSRLRTDLDELALIFGEGISLPVADLELTFWDGADAKDCGGGGGVLWIGGCDCSSVLGVREFDGGKRGCSGGCSDWACCSCGGSDGCGKRG